MNHQSQIEAVQAQIRQNILIHIRSSEIPRHLALELKENEILFIFTEQMTMYKKVSVGKLIDQIPIEEREMLSDFCEEEKGKIIVSVQEDNFPLMSYAFTETEITN